jgi:hypothetical protein
MEIRSGKHEGKTTEELALKQQLALKQPDYAQWFIANVKASKVSDAFRSHFAAFDAKPFTAKCDGGCGRRARYGTTYTGAPTLYFWCDQCRPYSRGATSGKLQEVRTVRDVLGHIDHTMGGSRTWKRDIVRQLAEAKGLPKRVGKAQALAFFQAEG